MPLSKLPFGTRAKFNGEPGTVINPEQAVVGALSPAPESYDAVWFMFDRNTKLGGRTALMPSQEISWLTGEIGDVLSKPLNGWLPVEGLTDIEVPGGCLPLGSSIPWPQLPEAVQEAIGLLLFHLQRTMPDARSAKVVFPKMNVDLVSMVRPEVIVTRGGDAITEAEHS